MTRRSSHVAWTQDGERSAITRLPHGTWYKNRGGVTWARTVLEILSWVMFAGLVCFGVGFSIYWAVGASAFLEQMGWAFVVLGAGLSIAICAFFATPFVVMAKFLRGATVRNAVTCKGQTPVHQAGGKGGPGSQG
jgi:hypothetical protein